MLFIFSFICLYTITYAIVFIYYSVLWNSDKYSLKNTLVSWKINTLWSNSKKQNQKQTNKAKNPQTQPKTQQKKNKVFKVLKWNHFLENIALMSCREQHYLLQLVNYLKPGYTEQDNITFFPTYKLSDMIQKTVF